MAIRAVPARFCALAALMAGLGVHAAELPEIVWYFPDLPPHYIVDGAKHGQGFHDRALQEIFMPSLPGYRHRTQVVPMLRLLQIMKTEPNACAPSAVKTSEREQYMRFSKADLSMLSSGLFVRRSAVARVAGALDAGGKLSLTKLMADGHFVLGVPGGRRYGDKVDGVISSYQGKRNVYELEAQQAEQSLVQMTSLGRVDGVLGYPYEAAYHLDRADAEKREELVFYRLSEQPEYTLSRVACAKGKIGDAVIRALDRKLTEPAVQAQLLGYYRAWLDATALAESNRIQKRDPLGAGVR
jgi:uncharacterized protein (TIGR02285 family)